MMQFCKFFAVAKFTRSRAKLLAGEKNPDQLSPKQKRELDTLFATPSFNVFLPRTQTIASPSWLAKHVRETDNGGREVTCKRGRPQLFQLNFQPAMLSTTGGVDYVTGGSFSIEAVNIQRSKIQCVALHQEEQGAAPQWRLENYEDVDDEEEDEAEENQSNEDDSGRDSADEDQHLHAPAGYEINGHDQGFGSEVEDAPDEAVWEGGVEFTADENRHDPHEGEGEEEHDDGPSAAILRPRGKHMSDEWMRMVDEGYVGRLPQVKGSTIGRHTSSSAWSTQYPFDGGHQHFARHFGAARSALAALLQCMEWLAEQHFNHCPSDDGAALVQELQARRHLEEATEPEDFQEASVSYVAQAVAPPPVREGRDMTDRSPEAVAAAPVGAGKDPADVSLEVGAGKDPSDVSAEVVAPAPVREGRDATDRSPEEPSTPESDLLESDLPSRTMEADGPKSPPQEQSTPESELLESDLPSRTMQAERPKSPPQEQSTPESELLESELPWQPMEAPEPMRNSSSASTGPSATPMEDAPVPPPADLPNDLS